LSTITDGENIIEHVADMEKNTLPDVSAKSLSESHQTLFVLM
jgi:hypothetical protein